MTPEAYDKRRASGEANASADVTEDMASATAEGTTEGEMRKVGAGDTAMVADVRGATLSNAFRGPT